MQLNSDASGDTMGSESEVNLTGGQIQQALDFLIYEALRPLVEYSNLFDMQVAHLLCAAASNKKRKLSALPREEFLSNLAGALSETDRAIKFETLRNAKIERCFVYNFVVNFIKAADDYEERYAELLVCCDNRKAVSLEQSMAATEAGLGFSRKSLLPALRIASSYIDLAYEFRNKIVCQYIKHAYKQAAALCKTQGRTFSKKDVRQNLLLAVTKALDKYDCSRGALTSYINFWILSAMTYSSSTHGHEYGIAYTVPQSVRKEMVAGSSTAVNFSVSLDKAFQGEDGEGETLLSHLEGDCGIDVELERREDIDSILRLVKQSDSQQGLARLYLDLSEHIDEAEMKVMRRTMRSQLGILPKN